MRGAVLVLTAMAIVPWASACATEADAVTITATSSTEGLQPPSIRAAELRFAPVVMAYSTSCGEVAAASDVVIDPETLSPGDGECFVLGDSAALDGRDVVRAEAAPLSGTWTVALELSYRGIDHFNDLAQACFGRALSCPTGQVAVLVDDVVISAPVVQQSSFERDQIQISGTFDEGEAKDLALALTTTQP